MKCSDSVGIIGTSSDMIREQKKHSIHSESFVPYRYIKRKASVMLFKTKFAKIPRNIA